MQISQSRLSLVGLPFGPATPDTSPIEFISKDDAQQCYVWANLSVIVAALMLLHIYRLALC